MPSPPVLRPRRRASSRRLLDEEEEGGDIKEQEHVPEEEVGMEEAETGLEWSSVEGSFIAAIERNPKVVVMLRRCWEMLTLHSSNRLVLSREVEDAARRFVDTGQPWILQVARLAVVSRGGVGEAFHNWMRTVAAPTLARSGKSRRLRTASAIPPALRTMVARAMAEGVTPLSELARTLRAEGKEVEEDAFAAKGVVDFGAGGDVLRRFASDAELSKTDVDAVLKWWAGSGPSSPIQNLVEALSVATTSLNMNAQIEAAACIDKPEVLQRLGIVVAPMVERSSLVSAFGRRGKAEKAGRADALAAVTGTIATFWGAVAYGRRSLAAVRATGLARSHLTFPPGCVLADVVETDDPDLWDGVRAAELGRREQQAVSQWSVGTWVRFVRTLTSGPHELRERVNDAAIFGNVPDAVWRCCLQQPCCGDTEASRMAALDILMDVDATYLAYATQYYNELHQYALHLKHTLEDADRSRAEALDKHSLSHAAFVLNGKMRSKSGSRRKEEVTYVSEPGKRPSSLVRMDPHRVTPLFQTEARVARYFGSILGTEGAGGVIALRAVELWKERIRWSIAGCLAALEKCREAFRELYGNMKYFGDGPTLVASRSRRVDDAAIVCRELGMGGEDVRRSIHNFADVRDVIPTSTEFASMTERERVELRACIEEQLEVCAGEECDDETDMLEDMVGVERTRASGVLRGHNEGDEEKTLTPRGASAPPVPHILRRSPELVPMIEAAVEEHIFVHSRWGCYGDLFAWTCEDVWRETPDKEDEVLAAMIRYQLAYARWRRDYVNSLSTPRGDAWCREPWSVIHFVAEGLANATEVEGITRHQLERYVCLPFVSWRIAHRCAAVNRITRFGATSWALVVDAWQHYPQSLRYFMPRVKALQEEALLCFRFFRMFAPSRPGLRGEYRTPPEYVDPAVQGGLYAMMRRDNIAGGCLPVYCAAYLRACALMGICDTHDMGEEGGWSWDKDVGLAWLVDVDVWDRRWSAFIVGRKWAETNDVRADMSDSRDDVALPKTTALRAAMLGRIKKGGVAAEIDDWM